METVAVGCSLRKKIASSATDRVWNQNFIIVQQFETETNYWIHESRGIKWVMRVRESS